MPLAAHCRRPMVNEHRDEKRDQAEIDKLWKAATELGFW